MIALTAGHVRLNVQVKLFLKITPITGLVRKSMGQFLKKYILSLPDYAQNAAT
jgi:hypothetical protein